MGENRSVRERNYFVFRRRERGGTRLCQQLIAGQQTRGSLAGTMTEPASTSSSSSSGAPALAEKRCDEAKEDEVAAKKPRLETCDRDDTDNKLEARLGGILCCAVCLDLPRSAVYQVSAFSLWVLHGCLFSGVIDEFI